MGSDIPLSKKYALTIRESSKYQSNWKGGNNIIIITNAKIPISLSVVRPMIRGHPMNKCLD